MMADRMASRTADMAVSARDRYQTYRSQNYEVKTVRLTSPLLHIGSEVSQLNKFEYVQSGDRVYFPRQDALARLLYDRGGRFLNDYIDCIERNRSVKRLLEDAFGENWQDEKAKDGRPIFANVLPVWSLEDPARIEDVRPMIRDGMGDLYVPGSSIKGAMRTAIAYYLLQGRDRYGTPVGLSDVEERIRQSLGFGELQQKRSQKFYDDSVFMGNIFENFNLQYQNKNIAAKTGPNTDFMRAIKVWDSKPLATKKVKLRKTPGKSMQINIPVLPEVVVSSYFSDRTAKYRASIFAECVRTVGTEFKIAIDFAMLESYFSHCQGMKIPFHNLAGLIGLCKNFAERQWQEEVRYWERMGNSRERGVSLNFDTLWEKFYDKEKCPFDLRLGWGSGMFGTTISAALKPELRQEIRDACGIPAPGFEAPKSRRIAVNREGEPALPLGWSQLKILDG